MDRGGSKSEACCVFQIGHDTIYRWFRLRRKTGSVAPKVRKKYKTRKLEDKQLTKYVGRYPDRTLMEIGEAFGVSDVAILKALRRLKITHKKKPSIL